VTLPDSVTTRRAGGWLARIAPICPIIFALWLLIGFLSSGDTGDTPEELIAYAEGNEIELGAMLFLGLATPLLIGPFLAAVAARMGPLDDLVPRALTLVGGTTFIVFFAITMLFWSGPLLDNGDLTTESARSYLLFEDFGWFTLGTSGVGAGLMIIGVSLAGRSLGWTPPWLFWVGIALGIASFATIAFLGMFAWLAWFIAAGALLLWRGDRIQA
jgi:hypothetical protein